MNSQSTIYNVLEIKIDRFSKNQTITVKNYTTKEKAQTAITNQIADIKQKLAEANNEDNFTETTTDSETKIMTPNNMYAFLLQSSILE